MPTPDHSTGHTGVSRSVQDLILRAMAPSEPESLALQVEQLRRDVDELRAQLDRAPSLILTGERVVAEMRRLQAAPARHA